MGRRNRRELGGLYMIMPYMLLAIFLLLLVMGVLIFLVKSPLMFFNIVFLLFWVIVADYFLKRDL